MKPIKDQTNVKSLRFGAGSIKNIGKETGRFVVTTMDIPWGLTKDRINGAPEAVVMVESIEQDALDLKLQTLPACDTIIAIGGGKAIDVGKYFAWRLGRRLVTIPTILSVDAFVTPAAGVRKNHQVVYVGETSPDPLIIDDEIIRTAPPALNRAGTGDLLSIHTATFDWEFAHNKGHSEYPFSSAAIAQARALLQELYTCLPDIHDITPNGIRALVEGYMKLNTICLPAGHSRVEEGSEHYLFYELEERLQRPFIHGHIVGLGIYLMSRLQNNRPDEITRIMNEVELQYHPAGMAITREDLTASLLNLKSFVQKREQLWYTIVNDKEITQEWIDEALSGLLF